MARVRRFRSIVLALAVFGLTGSPALWTQAQAPPETLGEAAWTPEEAAEDVVGSYQFTDKEGDQGVRCVTDLRFFPGTVTITLTTASLSVMPTHDQQVVGVRANLFQRQPSGSITPVAQSMIDSKTATGISWVAFSNISIIDLSVGPHYLLQLEIIWFTPDGQTVEGRVRRPVRYYHQTVHREGGTLPQPDDDACQSPDPPVAILSTDRGTVNSRLNFDLYYLPIDAPLEAEWDGRSLASFQTNDRGEVHDTFRIPAAPMGPHTIHWFTGTWTVSETFTVVPRIKVTPRSVARGQEVDVSLRGFAARENVRVRWRNGNSWEEIARVTTSSTGSANVDVTVPEWAADGANSVRGDAIASDGGRAQTNAVEVLPAGSIHLSPERGTVNSVVTATIANFPPNSPVTVTFHGFYEATASGTTDDFGQAVLTFRVPASPFGLHDVEATGGTAAATVFEVAPRIKLTPGEAAPGEAVGVSLRGFGARETVRIRWLRDGGFEQIATVTTSGSGSANLIVAVPDWAEDGPTSVRGDGPIGRAQTNAFVVVGGEIAAAEAEPSPSPTATVTPEVTPSPTEASATVEPTVTPEPTATLEPTVEPTAAPTEEPTALPTTEATATVEPTPTETHPPETNEGGL